MNERVAQIFSEGRVYDAQGHPHPLDSNISLAEAAELHALVKARRPVQSAEVGLGKGISALTILSAKAECPVAGAMHHVIDPFQAHFHHCGRAMVERLNLGSGFTLHERFPEEVIPGLPPLDFAFIDASHLFDLTLLEFVLVDKKLGCGGVVGLHDLWMPSLQKLVRFVLNNRDYRLLNATPAKPRPAWRRWLVGQAARNARLRRWMSPELLAPFPSLGAPNLVFLEKLGEDRRDWKHFVEF